MRNALWIALLATSLTSGQTPAVKIPSYKDLKYPPLKEVKIPEVARYTLPNGMKVYLLENHELPLVSGFAPKTSIQKCVFELVVNDGSFGVHNGLYSVKLLETALAWVRQELDKMIAENLPLEFGHSLTDLLGGQLDAGFVITDMYEDYKSDSPLARYHPGYIATRAVKK